MANNKSAKKRIKITKRNRLQNQFYRSSLKTLIKIYLKSIEKYSDSKQMDQILEAKNILKVIHKFLDKGNKRKVFHKNTVARKKSRLAGQLKKHYTN